VKSIEMAHIFKHPTKDQKGIITLTHKELRMLYKNHPYFKPYQKRVKRVLEKVTRKTGDIKISELFVDSVEAIRERYFIGVHFGWLHENFPHLEHVDFYMGGAGTIDFQAPEREFFIPLDGSNFIPDQFYLENPKSYHKEWDILMVSRDVRWKNLDKFMAAIRSLYDRSKLYNVLLIVPSNHQVAVDQNPKKTYTDLLRDYERLFSYEERCKFSILKTHPDMPFLGMAQGQIAKFYHLSKVFALFSETEGGSRVVSEALLAGLPVVVKKDLKGGGRDFLTSENAVFFDDFEHADQALETAVEHWESMNTDNSQVKAVAHEKHSLEELKAYFNQLFTQNNQSFDGELINTDWLSFRINGHWHGDLPWAQDGSKDADIVTKDQWDLFLNTLHL
jgi:glycosyltransferase involved in cell wall biosynthesis